MGHVRCNHLLEKYMVETNLKHEEERDPLVVPDLPYVGIGSTAVIRGSALLVRSASRTLMEQVCRSDPGKGDVDPGHPEHRTGHEVRTVYPAVRVERLNRYVPEISFENRWHK